MSRYQAVNYWSIAHGMKMVRVSLTDDHGREHVENVPRAELLSRGVPGAPRNYRDNLAAVLDRIQDRIDAQ